MEGLNIEFVSYDGRYPNLCRGKLILNINGTNYSFGSIYDGDDFNSFWYSTGSAGVDSDGESYCYGGDWEINEEDLPDFLKPYNDILYDILNSNIPCGCCGGCI